MRQKWQGRQGPHTFKESDSNGSDHNPGDLRDTIRRYRLRHLCAPQKDGHASQTRPIGNCRPPLARRCTGEGPQPLALGSWAVRTAKDDRATELVSLQSESVHVCTHQEAWR